MAFTLFTSLCISLLYRQSVVGVTVHFSSPGGNHGLAGVYRAVFDVDSVLETYQSEATEMGADFTCASVGNKFLSGLTVRSLSYDSEAGRTLVQLDSSTRADQSTVISDRTCTPEISCGKYGPDYRQVMRNLWTKDNGFIKPIASWNDSLYFVYTPETEHVYYFGYRPYLQLRKVSDGYTFSTADYPAAIDVDSFSTLIANISMSDNWMQAAGILVVIPKTTNNEDLVYLTVVRSIVHPRPKGDDAKLSYSLVVVNGEVAKVLHMTIDTAKGWYSHSITSEGGVSYKAGMVCWTVADAIMCGAWHPDQPFTPPVRIENLLVRGEAGKVCKFSKGVGSGYGNVTTGIALVETPEKDGRLVLFFGCFSTVGKKGGMGLLVTDPDMIIVDIVQVTYDNETILAGAMFVTPDDLCFAPDNSAKGLEMNSGTGRLVCAMKLLLACLLSVMYFA